MVIAELKKGTEQKMDKSVQAFKADLGKVRTGRAHTGLLDHVKVDYYGTPTPLNQVAKVILLDARTIGVTPFEKKLITTVEKAIREADLGLNPTTSGDTIRLPMPPLEKVNTKAGGVFPMRPIDPSSNGNGNGKSTGIQLPKSTGAPAKHKPKKRK
jgi:ribosome recycling factor